MKPFTPIRSECENGEPFVFRVSTDLNNKYLYLSEFSRSVPSEGSYMMIDRSTAKWLRKQLKKALKTPEGGVV